VSHYFAYKGSILAAFFDSKQFSLLFFKRVNKIGALSKYFNN